MIYARADFVALCGVTNPQKWCSVIIRLV